MDNDDDDVTTITIRSVRYLHGYRLIYYCYNNFIEWIFDCFNCGSSYMWTSISTCVMSLLTVSMSGWIVVVIVNYNFSYCW